ncbi:ammonium transporter [Halodesulfovibrio aestuarii]|uniref:Ammonium transporter n=1 Tax=Halodesulfovibrio aestuarii TaxID=126333 RepID=A0ABV4JP77_9BACT
MSVCKGTLSRNGLIAVMTVLALGASASLVHAEEEAVVYLTQTNANIVWTLLGAILVMFMQAGFAMVECGLTRSKNASNILMKNMLDFAVGSMLFVMFGYGLMFGADFSGIFGTDGFFLSSILAPSATRDFDITFWFFQSVFAATAATIVSGSVAERTKFHAYILISIVITGFIYPIAGHWAWGGLTGNAGWLESLGFIDFAGSTVVHSLGGWVALAGAMAVGPRIGKYMPDKKPRAILGHSMPMAGLGVFILWFGWFGFNAGSTTMADGSIGYIALNTSLAGCAGMITAMITVWVRFGKPEASMTMNGVLAGLVGVTAGCSELSPLGAILVGAICGVAVVLVIHFIDSVLCIDDPVGAISVHGVCGALGTLSVGLFASPDFGSASGFIYTGDLSLFGVQLLGVVVFFAWAFGVGTVCFKLIDKLVGLRVSRVEEIKGLDITEHGSEAYNGFQIFSVE